MSAFLEWHRGPYTISTDPSRLSLDEIHAYISRSYWAEGRPKEVVARSLKHSLCFGVYDGERQIGLARVISDMTVFAYLADVYILEPYRGQGLAKWLVSVVMEHPALSEVLRWHLITRDAHGLYQRVGFGPLDDPARHMERLTPTSDPAP